MDVLKIIIFPYFFCSVQGILRLFYCLERLALLILKKKEKGSGKGESVSCKGSMLVHQVWKGTSWTVCWYLRFGKGPEMNRHLKGSPPLSSDALSQMGTELKRMAHF
uniref:Uncharacterized protein n=1 Tax=Anguilla anguilla TaxID=7936 RepID=A0A0E9X0R2_ANGAN